MVASRRILSAVERHIANLLLARFEKQGHVVVMVENGRDATHLLATDGAFSHVIVDINLPVVSGLEVLQMIKASEATRGTWVAIWGGRPDVLDVERYPHAADLWIDKSSSDWPSRLL